MTIKLSTALLLSLSVLASSSWAKAKINNNQPPLSLTVAQLEQWSPDSSLADKRHIATMPLQPRVVAELGNRTERLDGNVKVLIAPDGMNNLANYLGEQSQFNLYNFTHWSHIDVINWFAGTANETVSLPSKPWVEAAHKNGVKVIGTVYLAVAQYGGNIETVERMVQQDAQGRFPLAHQLVAIASFYGFDGWLINPETDLTRIKDEDGNLVEGQFQTQRAAKVAKQVQAFMLYLTELAPDEMEIHWYDAMLLDGTVRWQNQLNERNADFFQLSQGNKKRASDAMFLNYWWNGEMVEQSHHFAKQLGRSPYDLYFGADLSPMRNAQRIYERRQWLDALFTNNGTQGLSSIALFANDVNFTYVGNEQRAAFSHFKNDANDVRRFHDAEVRLFAGDDLNIYTDDLAQHWPGIARYVPAKAPALSLPFSTSFNTGHGRVKANQGKMIQRAWHDVSQQDILPTWQFAVQGEPDTQVFYDFDHVYQGGNSLAIQAPAKGKGNYIPLYHTSLTLHDNAELAVTFMHQQAGQHISLTLETLDGEIISQPLTGEVGVWQTRKLALGDYAKSIVSRISLSVKAGQPEALTTYIGQLDVR
ncbi:endo-beta-N-acetylglucosaminidase [Thalassotalea fusca]